VSPWLDHTPKTYWRLYPARCPRRTPIQKVLFLSLRAHIGVFGSTAATNCANPRGDDPSLFRLGRIAPWLGKTPWLDTHPNRTGGATTLQLYACLNPAGFLRVTPARVVLSPSLRARIGDFGSTAVTKCASLRGDGVFRAPGAGGRFSFILEKAWAIAAGTSAFRGGSALKYFYTRPQARRHDHSIWYFAWMVGSV